MKKQWLLFASALIQLNVEAQTEKGGKLIGASLGSFNYTYQTQRYYRTPSSNPGPPYYTNSYNFTISPSIAWLVKNNFAVGPYVNLTYSHAKQNNAGTISAFNLIVGPQARGYLSSGQKGKAFIDVSIGLGFLSGKEVDEGYYSAQEYKLSSLGNFNGALAFGYEHFITKNVGLFGAVGVGYTAMNIKYDDGHNSSYDYDLSKVRTMIFPVQFGFQIHLAGNEKEAK